MSAAALAAKLQHVAFTTPTPFTADGHWVHFEEVSNHATFFAERLPLEAEQCRLDSTVDDIVLQAESQWSSLVRRHPFNVVNGALQSGDDVGVTVDLAVTDRLIRRGEPHDRPRGEFGVDPSRIPERGLQIRNRCDRHFGKPYATPSTPAG